MNTSFFGRITRDPKKKQTRDGKEFLSFTVAVSLPVKMQSGEYKTLFVDVLAFGKQGESVYRYFGKGSRIVVDGIVRNISIERGNNGQSYLNVNVSMTDFSFIDTKNENDNLRNRQQQPSQDYSARENSHPDYKLQNVPPPSGYSSPPPDDYYEHSPWVD